MKFLKPLTILGAICLALVVIAELVVRLLFPVPLHPPGGILLTNEITGVKASVNFDYSGDGLRTLNWTDKKKSKAPRILAVGGDGTTALLQSAPDAWWGQLAGLVSEAAGKGVEVAAFAETGGGKALPSVAATEKVLKRYKVDVVIAVIGFMDLMGTPGDAKFSPASLDRLRKLEPVGGKYQLAKISHLVRMIRNAKTSRIQRAKQQDFSKLNYYKNYVAARGRHLASRPVLDQFNRTGDDPLKNYILGIEALAAAAEKNGAKLLIVGEPTIYKALMGEAESVRLNVAWLPTLPKEKGDPVSTFRIRPSAVEAEIGRFYAAAGARCAELGVGWVNLQGKIPSTVEYFVTETNLTDLGARSVADALLPPVAGLLGIEGVPAGAADDDSVR